MAPRIIGEDLLARDDAGRLRTRIATAFPRSRTLVTIPGIHATQRMAFIEEVNAERLATGLDPLAEDQEDQVLMEAVDLIVEEDVVLIRPDPSDMELAFEADELLQELISKKRVKFLHVLDAHVREAIRRRGERWRISPLPRSPQEMKKMILSSRIGITGKEIYYYNKSTGARILTYQEFSGLAHLPDAELRQHLAEVGQNCSQCNRLGTLEVDFFVSDDPTLAAAAAQEGCWSTDAQCLHAAYESLRVRFRESVRPEFHHDDPDNPEWRSRMYAALIGHTDKEVSEEALLGLSAEFFMQIEWLPGGRVDEGELILDPVFEEEGTQGESSATTQRICDERARGFIFNFIRDYGDLEYINIGRVNGGLSSGKPAQRPRTVYLAEIKQRGNEKPILRIIRMQKWGVREHLDEGKDLLSAILNSDEYTEYILDRRLGCRQLGMNLTPRVTSRKVGERYTGRNHRYQGRQIWSTYFERDYVPGLATDKIASGRFEEDSYAQRFARSLGRAAAPNLIVGRCDSQGNPLFDRGDELVVEDLAGHPIDIVIADHTGTFGNYRRELREQLQRVLGRREPPIHLGAQPQSVRRRLSRRLRPAVHPDPAGIPEAAASVRHALQAPATRRRGELPVSMGMRAKSAGQRKCGEAGRRDPRRLHAGAGVTDRANHLPASAAADDDYGNLTKIESIRPVSTCVWANLI